MRFIIKISLILFLVVLATNSFSQIFVERQGPSEKFAKLCMKFHNYHDALIEYEALLKKDSTNVDYKYNIGICHLRLNKDKSKAIPYFLWVSKQDNYNYQLWYDLGLAYFVTGNLDNAKMSFSNYIQLVADDSNFIPAKRQIEMIENALKSVEIPVNVEITNLGSYVNSDYPEFNPFVTANEKLLAFSVQSNRNIGSTYRYEDGYFPADIYTSNFRFGKWRRARRMNTLVNSKNIESIINLSPNGSKLFILQMELIKQTYEIQIATKRGRHYRDVETLFQFKNNPINSVCISPDNKRLYFSQYTESGLGGYDIFYKKRMPDRSWSVESYLDSNISTVYDDINPYFSPDGKNFYFSSQGFNSIGGFDLFKATYSNSNYEFKNITNLGYPVNTFDDDKTISFNSSGRYAYISSLRESGYGDLDIYRVIFKDAQPVYTIITGGVYNQDSIPLNNYIFNVNEKIERYNEPILKDYRNALTKKKDTAKIREIASRIKPKLDADIEICVYDSKTESYFGTYKIKTSTSNYTVILPPGNWRIEFQKEGFETYIFDNLNIEEIDMRNNFITKHILLQKIDNNEF